MIKTYDELNAIESYEDRYNYLKTTGQVGHETFGYDRYINQGFYRSKEWKDIRNFVIARDNGCDMGHPDHPIKGRIEVHHINPIRKDNINDFKAQLDPNNLVCVSHYTHEAIHYGTDELLSKDPVERTANDTCPWKH